jgi:hypothetical protein
MNMSFGRLLAAGKSWVGGDAIGRYRMQKHILLPKFISPRNPFKSEAPQEAPLLPVVMPAATPVVETAEGTGIVMHRVSWPARAGAGLRRFSLFCLDHNPFGRIGQAKQLAIPRFGRSGVQGELSLDKVKVLRNDLAHADLEVVQVGAGGDQAATPAWKNLTARIFGAGLK